MLVKCKVCGAEYDFCPHCAKVRSWRRHADTADHYYIWLALMTYQTNHDARAAYDVLQKRGTCFQDVSVFLPSIQSILAEIKGKAEYTTDEDADNAEKEFAEELEE